ncbi:MAG: bifunctional proline dehydrogenase/L-glutamate gamma-semialdehyde dehydrogenase PutA [Gammaproteobacteria bacterium]|nr:MAG: bifunctional proline dehydrogenase/L-glutamate gamma-semialdehyde dehydrogenase PutA [Gammaproteobacteria bacterium]
MSLTELRYRIRQDSHADERGMVEQLLSEPLLGDEPQQQALGLARRLVTACRADRHRAGTLESFLKEFGLSNREGIALMCLAEALLRVPDEATADRLIAEKIRDGDWASHRGHSDSLFVNASVWGLMLTGEVLPLEGEVTEDTPGWVMRLVNRLGEPVVRKAMMQAMRIMGSQYVMGRTLSEAMQRGHEEFPRATFSFDMLGEGARTRQDADRYFDAYADAIRQIGSANQVDSVAAADGISVKLSALHPRYQYSQRHLALTELLARLRILAVAASSYNIGLSIDAEEAARLELSLDLFEALARDTALKGWQGLGFVLQAYQKRAPAVANWLLALAADTGRHLMVRLVKGAYWDSEIKWAQEQGLADYPVFTRKVNTDLCYLHCAERLLSGPGLIYPQFATHNAQTVASLIQLAGDSAYELQRLHGMGELLFRQLSAAFSHEGRQMPPVRIYAPVGQHRELLPYLVRRLLENGANSSFVNRLLDERTPVETLVQPLLPQVTASEERRHRHIPKPADLYRSAKEDRSNTPGIDLDNPLELELLMDKMAGTRQQTWRAGPLINGELRDANPQEVLSPTDNRLVGTVCPATEKDVQDALDTAYAAQGCWNRLGGSARADLLDRAADELVREMPTLMALITAEAGRTVADALSEVREAIDFCRYYAHQARLLFSGGKSLPGPTGEDNQLSLHGRGVFLCISPWNFPLAIFTGQVTAALAAGNTVLAKPAAQTPLVAMHATQLLHRAGIPGEVLQLLPGDGAAIGSWLLGDSRIAGVAFTGSTNTARAIQRQLTDRPGAIVPLIAETGGQNVMLVDSTALPEQVVDDVLRSAFLSAGQRCSALRVLFVQDDIADDLLQTLAGALQTLTLGDPSQLATDIGPVIDKRARENLLDHLRRMSVEGKLLAKLEPPAQLSGWFVGPHIFEINSLTQLPEEVFGPILHVIRYPARKLDDVIAEINGSGYGLTLGIHSRIRGFADYIFQRTQVGNTYINRNMVGAVVGCQPFGGCGLSGTGPKAGGPHYLQAFAIEKTRSENIAARGGNAALFGLPDD